MIKKRAIILLTILISLQLISAIDITLSKENYFSGETIQAEFSGNFLQEPDFIENIFLYREGTPRPISRQGGLIKQNNIYYLYIILQPQDKGNFSIHIENTEYTSGGEYKTEPITKDFTITQTTEPALSINPGFILTTTDFSVKIKSLNTGQKINAELEASGEVFNDPLLPEDLEDEFKFSIKDLETQKTNLKINDYNIPIFIIHDLPEDCTPNCSNKECGDDGCGGDCGTCEDNFYCDNYICLNKTETESCQDECYENQTKCFGDYLKICNNYDTDPCLEWGNQTLCDFGCENQTCINDTNKTNETQKPFKELNFHLIESDLPRLSVKIYENQKTTLQIFLENNGTENLSEIEITSDFQAEITPKKINLSKGEERLINLTINLGKEEVDEKNRLTGNLTAKTNNLTATFPIYIEITKNKSEVILTGTTIETSRHCSDFGEKCEENQECDEELKISLEGPCCPGKCTENKPSSSKWLIGIFIFLIVGIIIFIVYFRIKQKSKLPSPNKFLEDKTKEFRKRMSNETSGNLGRV